MSKRNRHRRPSVVLRAATLPLSVGLAATLGLMVFNGHDDPSARKADRLMTTAAVTAPIWNTPFQVASLSDDWMLHIVPAEVNGKAVLLAQSTTSTTTTDESAVPVAVRNDMTTQLEKLALEAQLTKGYADLARQDYKAAKEIFSEAVKKHPDRADLWRQLGYIEANLGDKDQAVSDFSKSLEIEPKDEQTQKVLEQIKKEAKLDKGYAALCQKDYKSAKDVFKEAVDKDPDNADLWRQLAYIELGLGNKDEALKDFEKVNEMEPGDPQIEAEIDQIKNAPLLEEGYKKLASKDYEAALKLFQGVVEKEPKRSDLWKQIAFIQSNMGNSLAAATAFDRSSELDTAKLNAEKAKHKAQLDAKLEEAYTALCSKDYESARTAYMEAVKIDPERADLWQQLGGVETNLGNIQAASDAFDRARALKPAN